MSSLKEVAEFLTAYLQQSGKTWTQVINEVYGEVVTPDDWRWEKFYKSYKLVKKEPVVVKPVVPGRKRGRKPRILVTEELLAAPVEPPAPVAVAGEPEAPTAASIVAETLSPSD